MFLDLLQFLGQFGLRMQFSIARIHRHRHDSARPSARAPRILHSNRRHPAQIELPGCGHARINVALKLNPINIFINPLEMVTFLQDLKRTTWTLNPKFEEKKQNMEKSEQKTAKERAKNWDLTLPSLPAIGLLKHFTNSRPRLPLSSLLVTNRLRGSGRGQSGHLVSSNGPYCRHFECMAEEVYICARLPEKRKIGERGWMGGGGRTGTGARLF